MAVELHAMRRAFEYYRDEGSVTDTSSQKSWDYEVDIDGQCWHIEVKGTTGDPVDVILTPNAVAHARSYPFVALYVVSNINLHVDDEGRCTTDGGQVTHNHPWRLDDGELRPIGYKYRLPSVLA
ncbi:hypothetical protein Ahu01nite_052570 [Winogradskya humida]|uniref:Protein NO VEIN C-terminal domain-containing protein n=1 Tax=Winogradskya humida TaxID=113566 RepID=A0ABQ3ZU92_9ACTN|nr:hypothetical protein Ahu01nite_052570 [Actinoplanes humidus]